MLVLLCTRTYDTGSNMDFHERETEREGGETKPRAYPSLLVVARATFPPHALRTATTNGAKLPCPPVTTKVCPASMDTPKPASDKGHRQLTAWIRVAKKNETAYAKRRVRETSLPFCQRTGVGTGEQE